MISTNDQKVDKQKFEDNFDKIFGKPKPVQRGSFVFGADGKMVPRGSFTPERVNAPMIMPALKEFQSPIDQSMISCRSQLEKHNKRHGVTNVADYGDGYIERKAHERVNAGKKYLKDTRRSDIHDAIQRHS